MKKFSSALGLFTLMFVMFGCSSSSDDNNNSGSNGNGGNNGGNQNPGVNEVDFYMTTGTQLSLLELQNVVLDFGTEANNLTSNIEVTSATTYQTIDGFGYTLTGGSVAVINSLSAEKKNELLQDLFNTQSGIGVSYLRLSIGASDLNSIPFTYDDMPSGQTDVNLDNFSLDQDAALISLIQEILAINPDIKFIATPWSAPVWMKNNNSFVNGSLKPEYYDVYAQYFVKYVQGMAAEGITINAITPQNEPLNPYNNPSMVMQAPEQANFIKNSLGPAFQQAGITTKIVVYDHNCDVPSYPISIYNDAQASQYVDGAAFHLYAGDIGVLSSVHNAHPNKNLYFTEQYTASDGSFSGDLKWHMKNVIIGSTRNWSKNALEWNLANNSNYGPHTNGGCSDCKGAITTLSSSSYTKNVAYYIIAHVSKFVPPGSVRISSTETNELHSVAFKTPDNKIVLVVENDSAAAITYNIKYNGEWVKTKIEGNAVATYVWEE